MATPKHHSADSVRANTQASPRWRGPHKLHSKTSPARPLPGVAGDQPSLNLNRRLPLEVGSIGRDKPGDRTMQLNWSAAIRDQQINKACWIEKVSGQPSQQLAPFAGKAEEPHSQASAPVSGPPPSPPQHLHAIGVQRISTGICPDTGRGAGLVREAHRRFGRALSTKGLVDRINSNSPGRRRCLDHFPESAWPAAWNLPWPPARACGQNSTARFPLNRPYASRAARPQWSHPCRRPRHKRFDTHLRAGASVGQSDSSAGRRAWAFQAPG